MSYSTPPVVRQDPLVITPYHSISIAEVIAANGSSANSGNYPSANLAFFFPFTIVAAHTYTHAVWCSGTVSGPEGNLDIGVYDTSGTRLGSLGDTAQGASSTTTAAAFGTPISLTPGTYYLAFVLDSADGMIRANPLAQALRVAGCRQVASSSPLPSSVTFAALTTNYVPVFGISEIAL